VKIDEIAGIDFSKPVGYQMTFAVLNDTQLPLGRGNGRAVQAMDHAKVDIQPISRDLRL
jgi:hypothetical protein